MSLFLTLNIFHSSFYLFIVHFLLSLLARTKTGKHVTLYEVKHQNNVDFDLVLFCLSLNFELLLLASISVETFSMHFVDWFSFANLKIAVLALIRNSERIEHCCIFSVNTCCYLDLKRNLCFTLTITASVRWEIQQNLTFFCVSFSLKGNFKGVFLSKVQAVNLQIIILPKMNFFYKFFFWQIIYCFHPTCFHRRKSVLLKLYHLITLLLRLDQSSEIHFAASWWALIIKGRCNTLFKLHPVKCQFDFNCLPQRRKQRIRQQHRISDIKSAHVGHHIRKRKILAAFLKIRCAKWLSIRIGRILESLAKSAN